MGVSVFLLAQQTMHPRTRTLWRASSSFLKAVAANNQTRFSIVQELL